MLGVPATTRSATLRQETARRSCARRRQRVAGGRRVGERVHQIATAGPRISSPVSRHGSTPSGSPPSPFRCTTRHEADGVVDGDELAVIAIEPAKRLVEARPAYADFAPAARRSRQKNGRVPP